MDYDKYDEEDLGTNFCDLTSDYRVKLSKDEKIKCLQEILARLNKVLYVYDKSLEPDSKFNYKIYCTGLLYFVSSSNYLFEGALINVIVNINSILINDFEKPQIKRIVFESKNQVEYLLKGLKESN